MFCSAQTGRAGAAKGRGKQEGEEGRLPKMPDHVLGVLIFFIK